MLSVRSPDSLWLRWLVFLIGLGMITFAIYFAFNLYGIASVISSIAIAAGGKPPENVIPAWLHFTLLTSPALVIGFILSWWCRPWYRKTTEKD